MKSELIKRLKQLEEHKAALCFIVHYDNGTTVNLSPVDCIELAKPGTGVTHFSIKGYSKDNEQYEKVLEILNELLLVECSF